MKLYLFQIGDRVDNALMWKIVHGKDFHDAAVNAVQEHVVVPFDELCTPRSYRVHLMERDHANSNLEGVPHVVHTMRVDIGS